MKLKVVLQLPKPEDLSPEYTYILPDQLNSIENGICISIELSNVLDFIPPRLQFFQECVNKLRSKGTIALSGLDLVEISKLILNGKLTIDEANNVLYQGKQSLDNLQRLLVFIQNIGLHIIDKRISNIIYYIKAEKP